MTNGFHNKEEKHKKMQKEATESTSKPTKPAEGVHDALCMALLRADLVKVSFWRILGLPFLGAHQPEARVLKLHTSVVAKRRKHIAAGVNPMPPALCRDIVSRKALAAGCVRNNGTCPHRRLAPFRSKQVPLGVSPQYREKKGV